MYEDIIKKIKPELDKVIDHFKGEAVKIRTSRANPAVVEDIKVDCFGQKMTIKELGSISCPQTNQIVISPWDKSYMEPIEKAISQSNLGLNPVVSGGVIRLSLPMLTDERRQNLLKLLSEKKEEAYQTIRHWRNEASNEMKKAFESNKIGEDEKYKGKEKLQEAIDKYNDKIEKIAKQKVKEIKDQ